MQKTPQLKSKKKKANRNQIFNQNYTIKKDKNGKYKAIAKTKK